MRTLFCSEVLDTVLNERSRVRRQAVAQEWEWTQQQAAGPSGLGNRHPANVPTPFYVYPVDNTNAVPAYYTNVQYQFPDTAMEELEEVLSVASGEPPQNEPPICGTNGQNIPVSPTYDPVTPYAPSSPRPSTSSASSSAMVPAQPVQTQAAAQFNLQTGAQASVQVNSQQAVPTGQVVRNYSTTVPPPGMKILKRKDTAKVDDRDKETRKRGSASTPRSNAE